MSAEYQVVGEGDVAHNATNLCIKTIISKCFCHIKCNGPNGSGDDGKSVSSAGHLPLGVILFP